MCYFAILCKIIPSIGHVNTLPPGRSLPSKITYGTFYFCSFSAAPIPAGPAPIIAMRCFMPVYSVVTLESADAFASTEVGVKVGCCPCKG